MENMTSSLPQRQSIPGAGGIHSTRLLVELGDKIDKYYNDVQFRLAWHNISTQAKLIELPVNLTNTENSYTGSLIIQIPVLQSKSIQEATKQIDAFYKKVKVVIQGLVKGSKEIISKLSINFEPDQQNHAVICIISAMDAKLLEKLYIIQTSLEIYLKEMETEEELIGRFGIGYKTSDLNSKNPQEIAGTLLSNICVELSSRNLINACNIDLLLEGLPPVLQTILPLFSLFQNGECEIKLKAVSQSTQIKFSHLISQFINLYSQQASKIPIIKKFVELCNGYFEFPVKILLRFKNLYFEVSADLSIFNDIL